MNSTEKLAVEVSNIISDSTLSSTAFDHDIAIAARELGVSLDSPAELADIILEQLRGFLLEQLAYASESEA